MAYIEDLRIRLKKAVKKEKEQHKKVLKSPTMRNISKLHEARLEVKTVESRIKNYLNPSNVNDTFSLPQFLKDDYYEEI